MIPEMRVRARAAEYLCRARSRRGPGTYERERAFVTLGRAKTWAAEDAALALLDGPTFYAVEAAEVYRELLHRFRAAEARFLAEVTA